MKVDTREEFGIFPARMRIELALRQLLGECPPALVARHEDGSGSVCPILPTVTEAELIVQRQARDCPDDLLATVCVNLPGLSAQFIPWPLKGWENRVRIRFANGTALVVMRHREGWLGIAELGRDRHGHWRVPAGQVSDALATLAGES
jgi:hypothetical protein